MKVASLPNRTFKDKSVSLDQWSKLKPVVPVKAQLDNPNGVLKPGMFAELEVLSDRTPAVLLAIPKSALATTNDKDDRICEMVRLSAHRSHIAETRVNLSKLKRAV